MTNPGNITVKNAVWERSIVDMCSQDAKAFYHGTFASHGIA